jgi:hypothetical protein
MRSVEVGWGAGGDGLMPRGVHIGWHVDAM